MTHIIYSRVSTLEQNAQQQTDLLTKAYPQAKTVFEDFFTGKTLERVEFSKMREQLKSGDTLYVYDISRIGRDTSQVLQFTQELEDKNIKLVVFTLGGIDITSSHGKMIMTVLASVATMQREEMLEKQAIGIQRAKEEGLYKGRKANPETAIKCKEILELVTNNVLKLPEALKAKAISRPTYYRWKANNKEAY